MAKGKGIVTAKAPIKNGIFFEYIVKYRNREYRVMKSKSSENEYNIGDTVKVESYQAKGFTELNILNKI